MAASRSRIAPTLLALSFACLAIGHATAGPPPQQAPATSAASTAIVRDGDRIAWIGSSSTRIGVWTQTVEFLLRTRHPDLKLEFQRFTTGGGTFATGLANLDKWLDEFRPTLVVFNYGGNDAGAGRAGLPKFLDNMDKCVAKVKERGARVILVTPQAADERKSGAIAGANRRLYAEEMLRAGRERGLEVIDVHHPIESLQLLGQRRDPSYTILKDKIHLTNPAYIGWGYYFFDRLDLPLARSDAALKADGTVAATEGCEIADVARIEGGLAFTRVDKVLPILPPAPLPPRALVPLEAQSLYLLTISDLAPGKYAVRCEGQLIGSATDGELAAGVNLNALLYGPVAGSDDATPREAPWAGLAKELWDGQGLDRVGKTSWRFEVQKP